MKLTKFRSVKVGDTFYIPDAKLGTNKMNKAIKMSGKEAFGDSKIELKPSFPVYVKGKSMKTTSDDLEILDVAVRVLVKS